MHEYLQRNYDFFDDNYGLYVQCRASIKNEVKNGTLKVD